VEYLQLSDVTLAYQVFGAPGDPAVVLVCGCGQPAISWELGVVLSLTAAGYRVVTFDQRGVEPTTSPPAPYSVDDMVDDTLALLDHLAIPRAHIVGYSMGGWVAETITARHRERVDRAVFIGSCNTPTAWEVAITTVERDLAKIDAPLPRLFYATETMRYLPNHDLQDNDTVGAWLEMIGDQPVWENPGRLGQYSACLAWSTNPDHGSWWPALTAPCLVLAFEHDVDSPPHYARAAAEALPAAAYVEIAGAGHLGVFTHADQVGVTLVEFFGTG
jgi:pimeloyl-ACP methyl ester carboxylesterase